MNAECQLEILLANKLPTAKSELGTLPTFEKTELCLNDVIP